MALAQLSDEQTRTWTREQKDRWWLENIYRGDLPQLTVRSGLTGFLLGGILSATNLYVGGKTGVTLGVGRRYPVAGTKGNRLWVEGTEPICAGLITRYGAGRNRERLANVLLS